MLLAVHKPATAAVKNFGPLTLDVPSGWVTEQDDRGLYIIAQDGSSVVSILHSFLPKEVVLAEEAKRLSQKFKGTEPQARGDGKSYYFLYSDATTGHRAVYMVTAMGSCFIYIAQVGENSAADGIIKSMKYNQENL